MSERVDQLKTRTADLAGPGLRTFFRIAEAWALSEQETMKLLGISDNAVLQRWQAGDVSDASPDTIERVSYVLGIFKAINTLLPQAGRADAWMRAAHSHKLFGGRSALDVLMGGTIDDLRGVRQYLDAEVG